MAIKKIYSTKKISFHHKYVKKDKYIKQLPNFGPQWPPTALPVLERFVYEL